MLDFWATWCSSCIKGFPKLAALQAELGSQVQVVLVNAKQTKDNAAKVNQFLAKRKERTGYSVSLPIVLEDSVLQTLFPHLTVPHYVWIDKEGRLLAATGAEEVTIHNIRLALQNKSITVKMKKDKVLIDPSVNSLLLPDTNRGFPSLKLGSLFSGYADNFASRSGSVGIQGGGTRFYMFNTPLLTLYSVAFSTELKELSRNNQYIFDLPPGSNFKELLTESDRDENKYCYELVTDGSARDIKENFRQDLIQYFKVSVRREKKVSDAIILKYINKLSGIYAKGAKTMERVRRDDFPKFLYNQSLSYLVRILNSISNIPIIDDSGITEKIDLDLPIDIFSYNDIQLKGYLESIGFEVRKEKREMDVAVFSGKPLAKE